MTIYKDPPSATRLERKHRLVPIVLGVSYLAIAVGNLALPETLKSGFLLDYLTVALGIIIVFALFRLMALYERIGSVLVILFYLASLIPGMIIASGSPYSQAKLQALAIAGIVLITPLCLRVDKTRTFAVLVIGMGLFSVLYSVLLPELGVSSDTGRVSAFGLNPIGVARLTAAGTVIAFAVLMTRRLGTLWTNALALGVFALCSVASIATGSRGPVVAALVSCAVMLIALVASRRLSVWWLMALVVAAVLVIDLLSTAGSLGLDRILDGTDSGRSSIYSDTLSLILAHPAGIGWGNLPDYLPQYVQVGSNILYPHNLFLEVAVEGGWLAFLTTVLLTIVVFVGAWRSSQKSTSIWPLLVLSALTYSFVNAQFSSDIVGNRMMWVLMGFAVAFAPQKRTSAHSRTGSSGRIMA